MSVGWVPFWLAPPGFFWRFSWFIIFSCLFVFSTTCQLLLPSVIVTTLVLNTKRMRSTAACFSSQLLSRWIGQDTIEPSCQITLFFSEWVGRLLWEVVALSIGLKPSTTSQIRKGKPVNSTSDVQPSFMEKRTSGPKLFWYFGWLFFSSTQFYLSHCRIPDLYVCELVAHARGHVMALSTRREKRAAPDRPVRASGRTTERVQSFII